MMGIYRICLATTTSVWCRQFQHQHTVRQRYQTYQVTKPCAWAWTWKRLNNQVNVVPHVFMSTSISEDDRKKAMMARGLPKRKPIDGVKNVILVASGKGGVGKSTVAVNLAVRLAVGFRDKKIGLLDADIFGPSLPIMMNLNGKPEIDSNNLMIPLQNHGVKCMSMGFLVDEKAPVVWRGLMVMQAIENLVRGVCWGPLDVLIIDMPPGTGDTQLSIAQNVTVNGAIMVTTPQKVALQDALKGAEMFKKTSVPLLGFVLNMSSFLCPSCGEASPLVATKHAEEVLAAYPDGSGILGKLPFAAEVSETCDEGKPIVISNPTSFHAREFRKIGMTIMGNLEAAAAENKDSN